MNVPRRLWRMLDPHERRQAAGVLFLGMLMACSTFIGIASLAPFLLVLSDPRALDQFAALQWLRERLGAATDREFAWLLGVGFIVAFALTNAMNMAGTLAMQRFTLRVGDRLHAALLNEYLHRDYRFHARTGAQNLFNRVVFWVNRITSGILESGVSVVTNAMALVVIFGSVVWLDPWLALWALAWLGGGYLLLYSTLRRRLVRIGAEEARLIEARTRLAVDGLAGIKEVLLLGRQSHFVASFAKSCEGISRLVARTQTFTQSPRRALEVLTVVSLVAAALYVSARSAPGLWLTKMTFLGFAAYRLLPCAQQIFASIVRIRANRPYFDEVMDDLARGSGLLASRGGPEQCVPLAPRDAIALEAVSYRYAPDAPAALREVSLRIPAGAMVGFVGPNGCGKTTLIDVLAGLVEPDTGRVLVDGIALDESRRGAWRRAIAYVPQQMYLFEASVAENIAFGAPCATIDRARVADAARLARLDELVTRLPRGLDERIGGGARGLSGGERQRIAIARALYRDAPVLLLDEFTSALDGLAERDILDLLQGFRGSRTVLLVAHRLQTLRACDCIYEMESGAITRRGGIADLTSTPGRVA
jgi:HlyD family secretion protein